jgi:hypothetical protein
MNEPTLMRCTDCGEMVDPEGHRWECSRRVARWRSVVAQARDDLQGMLDVLTGAAQMPSKKSLLVSLAARVRDLSRLLDEAR